jgi:transposase
MEYVGIDWGYERAAWCARLASGDIVAEGFVPADADGLLQLVRRFGDEAKGCVEMMSGALWVRDQLAACGWQVEVADARKAKALAPLTAKTDKVDARLLAELARRDLVPALWVPSLSERELRERLRRRMHLLRLRTSAKARIFGLLTQWGVRIKLARLRQPDGLELLARRGVPEVWRRSVAEGCVRFSV